LASRLNGQGADARDGSDGSEGRAGKDGWGGAGAGALDTISGAPIGVMTLRGGTRTRLTKTGAQPLMPQTFVALAAVPKPAADRTTAAQSTADAILRTDSSLQPVQR
jgi:hypothetical protein